MSRLFLIDDHIIMREGLKALLESVGHEVVGESAEPTPAVAAISRLQPDIVLLDLSLGNRSGFEVLAEVTRRKLATRVIMLTMSSQPRHVAEAMRLGAWGYVLKGAESAQLLHAIETVSAGQKYLGAGEAALAVEGFTEDKPEGLDLLSPRERQILVMVARGSTSASIGEELHLSPKTVDTYRSRLMAKLGLNDIAGVVRWALQHGLVD
jgi:two-component system, NarL family, invasion response regulator UvrY